MASLAKTNKYLRTEAMRQKVAAKSALDCSVIEGARGLRSKSTTITRGKTVHPDQAPAGSDS
ncbi:MAG TPA: hypothetical protein DIS87_07745 [Armatimonadetes bacterium]|nr:hypothetical protein [Armatimonadota bacterium]